MLNTIKVQPVDLRQVRKAGSNLNLFRDLETLAKSGLIKRDRSNGFVCFTGPAGKILFDSNLQIVGWE